MSDSEKEDKKKRVVQRHVSHRRWHGNDCFLPEWMLSHLWSAWDSDSHPPPGADAGLSSYEGLQIALTHHGLNWAQVYNTEKKKHWQ